MTTQSQNLERKNVTTRTIDFEKKNKRFLERRRRRFGSVNEESNNGGKRICNVMDTGKSRRIDLEKGPKAPNYEQL